MPDNLNVDIQVPDYSSLSEYFNYHEVKEAIQKLKTGKAAGVDQIINEYIKDSSEVFIPVYVSLFNKILDSGIIPEEWVLGLIVPIYKKKGNVRDCNNYLDVTLLSCLGKLFTNILNVRLCNLYDDNAIVCENQAGFRRGYSTTDHIFLLEQIINMYCFKKKKLFCAFIDYSKAFDTVWREALWHKLLKTGIKGKFLAVDKSMYSNIKSCVYLYGMKSEAFASLRGVRQEENLSPLLFALFVNDLEEYLLEKDVSLLTLVIL